MKNSQGFFVKNKDNTYSGPYDSLNGARDDARNKGKDLLIYHGILFNNEDGSINDSQLFLVPKLSVETL